MPDAVAPADDAMHFHTDALAENRVPPPPIGGPMYNSLPATEPTRSRVRLVVALFALFCISATALLLTRQTDVVTRGVRGDELERHDTVVTTRAVLAATTRTHLGLLLDTADAQARSVASETGALVEIPARMNLLVSQRGNGWVSVTGAGLAPVYVRADEDGFARTN